jgi:hypothetical protein
MNMRERIDDRPARYCEVCRAEVMRPKDRSPRRWSCDECASGVPTDWCVLGEAMHQISRRRYVERKSDADVRAWVKVAGVVERARGPLLLAAAAGVAGLYDQRMRVLSAALAFCCAAAAVPATLSATSSPRALPDCLGHPQIRPTDILVTCADGGFGVDRLSWVTWGGSRAVGLGSAYVNDCTPNCAAGRFHRFAAVVIASGLQRCPNGETAYLTVTWAFIGRSPFPSDAPGTTDPRQTFRCGTP